MIFKIVVGIAAGLGILVIVIAAQNFQPLAFNLFGSSVPLPAGALLLGAWVSGLIGSGAIWQTKLKEVKSEKTLAKWETQDLKLHQEIESDKIKLLEAKIATLDAALKATLKKNS